MMNHKPPFLLTVVLLVGSIFSLQATHTLGGYLQVEPDTAAGASANTFRISLFTFADPAPANVDRCAADIEIWTTGSSPIFLATLSDVPRRNGPLDINPGADCALTQAGAGDTLVSTYKWSRYDTVFTFPGPGEYEIRHLDVGRIGTLVNTDNAETSTMVLRTTFSLTTPALGIPGPTPRFLNRPVNFAVTGQPWTHLPGALSPSTYNALYPDSYWDSLTFELTTPEDVTNYRLPDDPAFGSSSLSIDRRTGFISWDSPPASGLYLLGYTVTAWSLGMQVSHTYRELTVTVISDPASVPRWTFRPSGSCTAVGDTLVLEFRVYAPGPGDSVVVQLNNGPFGNNGPFTGAFTHLPVFNGEVYDGGSGQFTSVDSFPVRLSNGSGSPVDTLFGTLSWLVGPGEWGLALPVDFYAYVPVATGNGLPLQVGAYAQNVFRTCQATSREASVLPLRSYPQPVTDWLTLEAAGTFRYALFDLQGRRLRQGRGQGPAFRLDLSPLPAGLYLLTLQDAGGRAARQKVLKQ